LSTELASSLIAIRVIAIWNHNIYLTIAAALALSIQLGFYIRELTLADAIWVSTEKTCLLLRTETSHTNVTATLAVDFFLLVSMLAGLLRYKEARRFGLWKFLWNQGLIWLMLAAFTEIPAVVFFRLNLNSVMNLVFYTPELVILTTAATWMYRALSEFKKSHNGINNSYDINKNRSNARNSRLRP